MISLSLSLSLSFSLFSFFPPSPSAQGGNRPMLADDSDEEFDPVGGVPTDSELDKVKTVSWKIPWYLYNVIHVYCSCVLGQGLTLSIAGYSGGGDQTHSSILLFFMITVLKFWGGETEP